jgi:hypothetical protein
MKRKRPMKRICDPGEKRMKKSKVRSRETHGQLQTKAFIGKVLHCHQTKMMK